VSGDETDREIRKRLDEFNLSSMRLDEGLDMRSLIRKMDTFPTAGSVWYLVSMAWIKKWQAYVYMDKIEESDTVTQRDHPGKLDCSDIIEPTTKLFL